MEEPQSGKEGQPQGEKAAVEEKRAGKVKGKEGRQEVDDKKADKRDSKEDAVADADSKEADSKEADRGGGEEDAVKEEQLRVLYIFAGIKRRADVREHLTRMCKEAKVVLVMQEFDLERGDDALDDAQWTTLTDSIDEKKWDVVMCTPPCNTFSRARSSWQRSPGPTPIRSKEWPRGFPWLEGWKKEEAERGNLFIDKTFEVTQKCCKAKTGWIVEHPEDLGKTSNGDWPASLWQDSRWYQVPSHLATWAIYQCQYGAETSKPTRFISDLPGARNLPYPGWPKFTKNGKYRGPLPQSCPHTTHEPLLGRTEDGKFKTSPAANYPGELCRALAQLIMGSLKRGGTISFTKPTQEAQGERGKKEGQGKEKDAEMVDLTLEEDTGEEEEEEEEEADRLAWQGALGHRKPLLVDWSGKQRDMVDGFGLCSPTRLAPEDRLATIPNRSKWFCVRMAEILDEAVMKTFKCPREACIRLALGRITECPFEEEVLEEAREKWFKILPGPAEASHRPEHQPFFLSAIQQSLHLLEDPDWEVFAGGKHTFERGVPLGIGVELPRTPAVFRRKVRWRSYDESTACRDMKNYKSAGEAGDSLREQFKKEEEEGLMFEVSEEEAKRMYPGDKLRVAAQGAIEKGDGTFRIVHDATHGVQCNNEIKVRDQLDFPNSGDIAAAMNHLREREAGRTFAIAADIRKAHRRVLHDEEDWGYMACRDNSQEGHVWLNRVGTFGFGSIAYWWGRLAGGIGRLVGRILMEEEFWQMIFADDLNLTAGGPRRWIVLWRAILAWVVTGAPFSWKKFRGGIEIDFVGYWLDYARFEIGISDKRCQWLIKWMDQTIQEKGVLMRRFLEGVGRLGFTAQVLHWLKPTLAPLFAWAARSSGGAVLAVPKLVRWSLKFLREELQRKTRRVSCRPPEQPKLAAESFFTDAKCDTDKVVLGGWEVPDSGSTRWARWFSLTITEKEVPWLFKEGRGSSWASAAAELLAVWVAVLVFLPESGDRNARLQRVVKGGTDNQACDYVVQKGSSTKVPLCFVVMQLAQTLGRRNLLLQLDWRPREQNQEADDLTNLRFQDFEAELRIPLVWGELGKPILDQVLELKAEFEAELGKKREASEPQKSSKRAKAAGKTKWG